MARVHYEEIAPSEFRRQYTKPLVRHLRSCGFNATDARRAVGALLSFLQGTVAMGHPVDLGFLKIVPKRKPPSSIRFNLQGRKTQKEDRPLYLIGERYVWKVALSEKWLEKAKPEWWPR